MTPAQHWTQLTNRIITERGCTLTQAWLLASKQHPDLATLMSAAGCRRDTVNFFNSKIAARTPGKINNSKKISELVNAKMKSGLPYGQAFNAAAREHPELFSAVSGAGAQFSNAVDPAAQLRQLAGGLGFSNAGGNAGKPGDVPAANSQLKKIFRLPENASQAEFAAAWHGNGDKLVPINPGAIFSALVDAYQAQKSLDYEAAITNAKWMYPELWTLVQMIAQEPV